MKTQSYRKGWAFVLTLALVFTTLFGGFGFLGINGVVGEVYAATDEWSGGTINSITVTDGAIINVTGTVTLDGTITISGSAIITGSGIIQAGTGVNEIVKVADGSTLTISGITIDANNSPRNVVQTSYNTFFNMGGASKIINSAGVGVWVSYSSGTFNMGDNAKISDCHSGDGGGVYNGGGTVILSGNAEISNCTANYRGGGGILADSGTFSMHDNAKITSCSAIVADTTNRGGGGVWIGNGIFNMNGGTIESCHSSTIGGGVMLVGGTFNASGSAKIENNTISGTTTPSNIHLNTGSYVQITGSGLTAGASLGITPATYPTGTSKVDVVTGTAVSVADAAYFSSDSTAHFITYSAIVSSNTLFLVANGWTPSLTPETTPTAGFEASTMVLSSINSGMKYSINGGTSYIDIISNGSITINGVTTASGIKVYKAGNGTTTTNSAIQTITITKAVTPATAVFTVTQPGTVGGTGTIAGITAAMEYSTNGGSSWTNGGSTVSGLAGSTTVLVRIKGAGTVLASDNCALTINAYIQTALVNSSFEIPTLGATHATNWWTDYKPTTAEEKTAFGWKTTATGTDEKFEVGGDWNINGWGISFIPDGRQFIELNANTQAAAYQDLNTTPGSVIYWSLYQGGVWYSSSPNINNTMAVRIGSPEQLSTSAIMIQTTDTGYDQRWTTRTIYNNATMTAINTTPTTYGAMELTKKILYTEPKRWTKYEGTYEVPAGQTETRFAFASLSAEPTQGNLLDGVVFRIANTTKAITAFNFNGLTPNVAGTINEGTKTIAITVPYGTDVTALVPTITHTGASISPSAVVAQNFTGPVTYTVTPETGAAQEYVVTVTVAMPTKAITEFNFNGLTPNVTGTVNETAKTIALTVPYGTDVTALVPTITYSGVSITSNSGIAQNFTNPVTYTVTAADSSTQAYIVTVTVASNGGGGHSSSSTAPANATVNVNGQSQAAGTVSTSKVGDKTVTTVTIDDKKIQEKIKEEGNQSTVSIPIGGSSDIGEGVLNGQTIKDMENKESVLEIKTNSTTYTLPASEINIDSVSSQFGQTVELKDIKISVKIAEPSTDTTKIVQDTANKNNYQVVVKPVNFEITCTSGSKTVSVSKFNGYVERMVAIPDGIDPSKVTTGIVLNNDGTFSHVPTTIVKIDGKYYAKINSLTNSTYSVIYNPIEFADVAKHWAKDSINEMGSRLVISGVGEDRFEPNRDITRAEFAAIMVRALGLAPDTTKNNFSDVADSKWYSGYVGTAASYGIISGYDTDTFAPNDKITREQAMTMVARAMAITDLDATTADLSTGTPLAGYSDTNKISGYAKAGITACLKTGVVTGKTADTIAPKKNITRAEVAVIIERLLKKSELI